MCQRLRLEGSAQAEPARLVRGFNQDSVVRTCIVIDPINCQHRRNKRSELSDPAVTKWERFAYKILLWPSLVTVSRSPAQTVT